MLVGRAGSRCSGMEIHGGTILLAALGFTPLISRAASRLSLGCPDLTRRPSSWRSTAFQTRHLEIKLALGLGSSEFGKGFLGGREAGRACWRD